MVLNSSPSLPRGGWGGYDNDLSQTTLSPSAQQPANKQGLLHFAPANMRVDPSQPLLGKGEEQDGERGGEQKPAADQGLVRFRPANDAALTRQSSSHEKVEPPTKMTIDLISGETSSVSFR